MNCISAWSVFNMCSGGAACGLKTVRKPKIAYNHNYPLKSLKSSIKYMVLYIPCNMYTIE